MDVTSLTPRDDQGFCKFKSNIFNEFAGMWYSGFIFFPLEGRTLQSLRSRAWSVPDTYVLVRFLSGFRCDLATGLPVS